MTANISFLVCYFSIPREMHYQVLGSELSLNSLHVFLQFKPTTERVD